MNNNNDTDKKLQDLENLNLPDLSQMNAHWQQMHQMIDPRPSPVKRGFSSRGGLQSLLICGVVVLLSLLLVKIFTGKKKNLAKTQEPFVLPSPSIKKDTSSFTLQESATVKYPPVWKETYHSSKAVSSQFDLKKMSREETGQMPAPVISVITDTTAQLSMSRIDSLFRTFEKTSQQFVINSHKDTILKGREGTVLRIPAGSFTDSGIVVLELKEFYKTSDMVLNRLTTLSDGQQLVTGGMIHLEALVNNKKTTLKAGSEIHLQMPRKNEETMQLFYGKKATDLVAGSEQINWKPAGRDFTMGPAESPEVAVGELRVPRILWKEKIASRSQEPITTTEYTWVESRIDTILKTRGVNISQLGMINSDRFPRNSAPSASCTVDLGDTACKYFTILIFDKLQSILPGSNSGNKMLFKNVPIGEPVTLISIGMDPKDPVCAIRKIKVAQNTTISLKPEAITTGELKNKLEMLDISPAGAIR